MRIDTVSGMFNYFLHWKDWPLCDVPAILDIDIQVFYWNYLAMSHQ